MKKPFAAAALLFMVPALAWAQGADHQYRGQAYFVFGLGAATPSSSGVVGVKQLSFGGEGFLYKGLGLGAEAGYSSRGAGDNNAWIGSADITYHFGRNARRGKTDPFVLAGATGYFPTNRGRGTLAANFGGGLNLWIKKRAALRFEVRHHYDGDYGAFGPGVHYLSFRIGMTFR